MPRKAGQDSTAALRSEGASPASMVFPTPALSCETLRFSYHIGRGEQGVLTFEPYKSILLPHWRFKTALIAQESSQALASAFDYYVRQGDFVGADMARKFIQMGMTRAGRYANRVGGRKYRYAKDEDGSRTGQRELLPKTQGHKGQEEKRAASDVFREVWQRCKTDADYIDLKENWVQELKDHQRASKHKD